MIKQKNNLKQKREVANLSQWTLAALSGFSQAWIWAIENGNVSPSEEAKEKIADVLGCKVSDIWGK